MIVAYMHALPTLFFNGLWQRYISSRCVVFPTSFLQRRAEQRRVFAPPCRHPRAGRQCIALTKRKACRASLLSRWAKRVTRRRCLEQPDEHTGRRAKRKKAKEKSIDAEPRALRLRLGPPAGRSRPDVGPGLVEDWTSGPAPQNPSNSYFPTSRIGPCPMLRFRLFRKPCDVCDACRTPPDARHGHFDLDGETSVSAYSRGRHC